MKKVLVFALLFCVAFTAFAARNLSLNTGRNNFPAALDAFPAFKYDQPVKQADIWLFYNNATEKAAYIRDLQRAGFKYDGEGTYKKGNAEVWFDDSVDDVVFSIVNVNRVLSDPTAAVLKAFPPFKAGQFGDIFSIDFDLTYEKPIPQSTLNSYFKALNAAGFEYSDEDDDYQLEVGDEKQYYFEIAEDQLGEYYTWSVLYH